jgi:uncharacterized NAD(P)/FAD-binding protein YdhS
MTPKDSIMSKADYVPVDNPGMETRAVVVRRPIPVEDGLRRLAERQRLAKTPEELDAVARVVQAAEQAAHQARLAAETDVVDAARRSQAEIRRHVDSYLKEHFEEHAGLFADAVLAKATEMLGKAVAAMQESQAFALDRIAADVRAQVRAIERAISPPKRAKKRARR